MPEVDKRQMAQEEAEDAVWRRVELARHPNRPNTLELLSLMGANPVIELHGDRFFGDDRNIVGGFSQIGEHRVIFVGNQRPGQDVEDRMHRNFGYPFPEGFRKASRLFDLAERFGIPVVTFIDTPGADPSVQSEERGQALAIAESIAKMISLRTPIVPIIIGEGGSGGALGIGVGDVVMALENSTYSVINPEGAAQILWRDKTFVKQAALQMHLTAQDQKELGVVDIVISEPEGGAHLNPKDTAMKIRDAIIQQLNYLKQQELEMLVARRYERYRRIGQFSDATDESVSKTRIRLKDRVRSLLPGKRRV